MGKRGGTTSSGLHKTLSLREEASGKKQSHNPKSILKLQHLQNLAEWASGHGKDDKFGCLGAFFGRRFADFGESLGISPDPSLFPCQRCETLLEPGSNCTVRIEKNRTKRRRHSKIKIPAKNNVVYTCNFCSHRNLKRGTPKGYIKEIAPSRVLSSNPVSVSSATHESNTTAKSYASSVKTAEPNAAPSPTINIVGDPMIDSPASPLVPIGATLLDSKRRKRKKPGRKASTEEASISSASTEVEKAGGVSKRRRKSWTTLKEIAEEEERERTKRFSNFSIPFVL